MPVEGALPLEGDDLLEEHSHMTLAEWRMGQVKEYMPRVDGGGLTSRCHM